MKNSRRIKEILVELAVNDQLPSDMNELDTTLFAEFDVELEITIGGFNKIDVETMATEQLNLKITDEQVCEVMDMMDSRFDASLGMNWDVIENCINEVLGTNKNRTI